ncbi:FecR family protein [Flavobacterium selenitireducens]|uniref:FecR family protein n=1 Tax=Flavobacterium selenitireducens TaxID=2722704 RepID=UPI00168AB023|nr:FecR domain-containing protein [Flavobacterium selenitireducens]MBD3582440.1 DUF4974 domain-containing protein [Flavobacterium selenitireducens]
METDEKYDLAKWMAGEMNDDELKAFRNAPEFETYEWIANASRDFRTEAFDQDKMLARVMAGKPRPKIPKVIPFYRSNLFRAAAVLILSAGLFFILKPNPMTTEHTAFGKTASLVLPDASHVELNSGSEITFDESAWNQKRELALKGEAYFKVAKGKTFEVNTDLGKVTVVGTQFNVKARGSRLEVECYEGKVNVTVGNHKTLLTPGTWVVFDDGNPKGVPVLDNTQPAWTQGEMQFTSAPLEEVIAEMERRFDVRIELKTKIDKTVSATFSGTDFQETMATICTLYKLNATTSNDVVILSAYE